MTASKQCVNQIRERSIQEKSPQRRWLLPFLLTGANLLTAICLVLLRASGLIQVQQSFLPLLSAGCLLSGSVAIVLLSIHLQRPVQQLDERKHLLTLALVVPVLAGMLSLHPVEGLSLAGIYFFSLTYFMAFAGVLEWLNREASRYQEAELLSFEDLSSDGTEQQKTTGAETDSALDHEAIFAAILEQGQETTDQENTEAEPEESFSQWMNRSMDQTGAEIIEGGSQVAFQKNQGLNVVHLSLNPPLEGTISVSCEVDSGLGFRTRVLESRAYGVSIEVKRVGELQTELECVLHYRITGQQIVNEDVA